MEAQNGHQSYTYPPGKEHTVTQVTREDLARHFASYNSYVVLHRPTNECLPSQYRMALVRIVNLHNKWVRLSPKGAMSNECQDLNALHSLVVDGGNVKVPDRLAHPPTVSDTPFILDQLREAAKEFHDEFMAVSASVESHDITDEETAEDLLVKLLTSEKLAVSEYELSMMAARFAQKHRIDIRKHIGHIDFSAFSTAEKHAFSFYLGLTPQTAPYLWNRSVQV